jgi:hypothetical protein
MGAASNAINHLLVEKLRGARTDDVERARNYVDARIIVTLAVRFIVV